ncbi:MAG: sigma-70 family RNA polymerase sigma factor [Rhodoglobus sp.]|nr:sigma-70 family RNA polymerase sigma factor [Rhodoglobus sp.]
MTILATAVTEFAHAEYARVVAAVGYRTGNQLGAADAVQDAIVRLLGETQAANPRNLAAWITVVASNRAQDMRRKGAAEGRAYRRLGIFGSADQRDPAELTNVDLVAALNMLPRRQREICVLHYVADLSVDSVAVELGVSAGTVKTHLHRARQSLAQYLAAA